jgi:hypothetical protein
VACGLLEIWEVIGILASNEPHRSARLRAPIFNAANTVAGAWLELAMIT